MEGQALPLETQQAREETPDSAQFLPGKIPIRVQVSPTFLLLKCREESARRLLLQGFLTWARRCHEDGEGGGTGQPVFGKTLHLLQVSADQEVKVRCSLAKVL